MTDKEKVEEALYKAGMELVNPSISYGKALYESKLPRTEEGSRVFDNKKESTTRDLDNAKDNFRAICWFASEILCDE